MNEIARPGRISDADADAVLDQGAHADFEISTVLRLPPSHGVPEAGRGRGCVGVSEQTQERAASGCAGCLSIRMRSRRSWTFGHKGVHLGDRAPTRCS